ncbi:YceD family protein [Marinibactrum halimedae]|uniref:Large ribosomal RNA subunit accumulation protein YceD n=1 Tax=Marinibactrum halimedae TaxID=1444977 RepID=A0AA37T3X2_9GAMM|nr:YceD family protein [Marinibactrum halimedae]MCD9460112.1 YceD family protein [Marinibactrum halimedae]GLS26513.1 hypothetical protein GCM10007877_22290 [Marinibactrum halimedae]
MSKPPNYQRLPRTVDPRKFAQNGVKLVGDIEQNQLERLSAAVVQIVSPVQVSLAFDIGEEGYREVTGRISAEVQAECQRCLQPTPLSLVCDVSVGVVWDEDQAKQLPSRLDPWIVGEGAADLFCMVEEELLLALPMVAFHAEQCVNEALFSSADSSEDLDVDQSNPFSVLEQLKSTPKK